VPVLGFGLPVSGSWATPETMSHVARRAEELGYASLWTFQRVLTPVGVELGPAHRSVHDSIVALAYIAGHTDRIGLGTATLCAPFAAPAVLANAYPPQRGPVSRVPVLDQQRRSRVGGEIPFPLQVGRRLRLDPVEGHTDEAEIVHGEHDGDCVDASLGVHRAQDPVVLPRQPGPRLLLGESHQRSSLVLRLYDGRVLARRPWG